MIVNTTSNPKNMPKILFICKQRPSGYGASYGLLNSCRFLCNALHRLGVNAKLVEVIDNNSIDREVTLYKPTHVFIEALWVVPEKFDILIPLHKKVQWYVRLHSNTPFIANEGVAIDWIRKYALLQKKYSQFHIAPNSIKMVTDLNQSLGIDTMYAPNIYIPENGTKGDIDAIDFKKSNDFIDIGCFGAIRPLKNQLIQAMAALAFAKENGKKLRFHINGSRIEQKGDNVYKNIVALFEGTEHQLIEHGWMSHNTFVDLIRKMDYGLQVSFSETFNIVAADFVYNNVPIVGSEEIEWMNSLYQANPTDINSIVNHLWFAKMGKKMRLQLLNNIGLDWYNSKATTAWVNLLKLDL